MTPWQIYKLLLPKALLKGETFITKLLEIDESEFLNDVEVIGWLYQFYISQKKDEVFASKKTITKINDFLTRKFITNNIIFFIVLNITNIRQRNTNIFSLQI